MGSSGSTRRVVVEDVDGSGVVKISDSVVKRLKGQSDQTHETTTGLPSSFPPVPSSPASRLTGLTLKDKATVEEIEKYYMQRLKSLEDRNKELQKITNEQFIKAVQEVEQKFLQNTSSPVCQDLQARVYECYLFNGTHTLDCSAHVRAFTTCVERARQSALIRKG